MLQSLVLLFLFLLRRLGLRFTPSFNILLRHFRRGRSSVHRVRRFKRFLKLWFPPCLSCRGSLPPLGVSSSNRNRRNIVFVLRVLLVFNLLLRSVPNSYQSYSDLQIRRPTRAPRTINYRCCQCLWVREEITSPPVLLNGPRPWERYKKRKSNFSLICSWFLLDGHADSQKAACCLKAHTQRSF